MSEKQVRPWQINQIPVSELRDIIASLLSNEVENDEMLRRLSDCLDIAARTPRAAIRRLTRQQANRLILECPEITPERLDELYREYRYGMNPSFRVFIFDRNLPNTLKLDAARLTKLFTDYFEQLVDDTESWPTVRRLQLNGDVEHLDEKPDAMEGTYRFSQLLEYIMEDDDPEATYETKYGYFWINRSLGYVAIHGSNEKVVKTIRLAFETVTDIGLVGLLISKQFRSRLSFINRASISRTSLFGPDPSSGLPQSLIVRDPNLPSKGLEDYEKQFSGKRDETSRTDVDDNTDSPLVVKQNGTFRLKGKVPSKGFRAWCLRSLEEVMEVWEEFGESAESVLIAIDVDSAPEYKKLRYRKKKEYFRELVDAVYRAKYSIGEISPRLSISPLELAKVFKGDMQIRAPYSCANLTCDESGYHKCDCGTELYSVRNGDEWRVMCANPDHRSRAVKLPLVGKCDQWHLYSLDQVDIEDTVEVRFGSGFKELIQEFVNKRVPRFSIDFRLEDFYITGQTLVYQRLSTQEAADGGNTYIQNQTNINRDQNIIDGPSHVEKIDQGGGDDDSA